MFANIFGNIYNVCNISIRFSKSLIHILKRSNTHDIMTICGQFGILLANIRAIFYHWRFVNLYVVFFWAPLKNYLKNINWLIWVLVYIYKTSADATPMPSAPMTISWMGVLVHIQTVIQNWRRLIFMWIKAGSGNL